MYRFLPLIVLAIFPSVLFAENKIHVPAFTAYSDQEGDGLRIRRDRGITDWSNQDATAVWFGRFTQAGTASIDIVTKIDGNLIAGFQVQVDDQRRAVTFDTSDNKEGRISLGEFKIETTGYHAIKLKPTSSLAGLEIVGLDISGTATNGAHFNLKPRRNAASVHLSYPIERGTEVAAFYCEMTGLEDPLWSYYMACGWHRGYFGMQVNSPTERRIIFSVWDSGGEAIDRKKVEDHNRVKLVAKGEGVYSGSFGNEGTGGHSHLKFAWKTGERQRFLVTAKPTDQTHTTYAGYYFRPDKKEWMLISSWNAPKEGGYMRGLYSFSENFVGRNGHLVRKGLYGNQWICDSSGAWHEVTRARFSHDPTGRSDRFDRYMGIEDDQFFLSHGGFTNGFTKFGREFQREPSNRSPEEMKLPNLEIKVEK